MMRSTTTKHQHDNDHDDADYDQNGVKLVWCKPRSKHASHFASQVKSDTLPGPRRAPRTPTNGRSNRPPLEKKIAAALQHCQSALQTLQAQPIARQPSAMPVKHNCKVRHHSRELRPRPPARHPPATAGDLQYAPRSSSSKRPALSQRPRPASPSSPAP
jgi:hypothetical protein